MLTLEMMDEKKRQTEKKFWEDFNNARPALLGALFDATAHGLSRIDHVKLNYLPRMADFFTWITACETALWPQGTFAAAYERNAELAVAATIEADTVATTVIAFMAARIEWEGTATSLLASLTPLVPIEAQRTKGWPKGANHLSGQLTRIAPLLRTIGIKISKDREGKGRDRLIHISRWGGQPDSGVNPSSAPSASSTANDINGLERTITEGGASVPSSGEPGDEATDDGADDAIETTVRRNPLQTDKKDDADDQDDHLRTLSAVAGAVDEDRSCRQ